VKVNSEIVACSFLGVSLKWPKETTVNKSLQEITVRANLQVSMEGRNPLEESSLLKKTPLIMHTSISNEF